MVRYVRTTKYYLWLGTVNHGGYPECGKEEAKRLHRFILSKKEAQPSPDHEPSHKCDTNCCINPDHLIWETMAENHARRKYSHKTVGCTYDKQKDKWKATHYVDGKRKFLGHFPTREEAMIAYRKAL